MIRILVADDHEVVRRGLKGLLEEEPGLKICAEATTGREAIEKAKQCRPDVVIMDIAMPNLNGLDATRLVLKAFPTIKVIILTAHESEQIMREVLEVGARGYVLKSDAGRNLIEAVRAVSHRGSFFTPRIAEMVRGAYLGQTVRSPAERTSLQHLTPREREMVQLLAEGKANKEIALALRISLRTVETHRRNIMHKLNLNAFSDLVHYAIRNNLVDL